MNLRYCQVNNAIPRNEVIWFKFAFDNYTKVYVNITERESYVNVYGLTFDWMSSFFSSVLFKPAYAILNPFWRDLKWCTYTCTCGNVISVFGAYHFKWFEWPWIYTLHILRCFTEDMPFCTLGACTYTLKFLFVLSPIAEAFSTQAFGGRSPWSRGSVRDCHQQASFNILCTWIYEIFVYISMHLGCLQFRFICVISYRWYDNIL